MDKINLSNFDITLTIKFTVKDNDITKKYSWKEPGYNSMSIVQMIDLACSRLIEDAGDTAADVKFNSITIKLYEKE